MFMGPETGAVGGHTHRGSSCISAKHIADCTVIIYSLVIEKP